MKLIATYSTCTDGRYYTAVEYKWFDDGDVEVTTVTGDDEWDNYNGYDSQSKKINRYDSLPKEIQEKLQQMLN